MRMLVTLFALVGASPVAAQTQAPPRGTPTPAEAEQRCTTTGVCDAPAEKRFGIGAALATAQLYPPCSRTVQDRCIQPPSKAEQMKQRKKR